MQRLSALLVLLVLSALRTAAAAGSQEGASDGLGHEMGGSRLRHGADSDRRGSQGQAAARAEADHPAAAPHAARAAARRESPTASGEPALPQSFAAGAGTSAGWRQGRETGAHAGMNASKPLPEHGFHGRLVAHKDGETYTKDWRAEYGHGPGYEDICVKYPDNDWCRIFHPPAPPAHRSSPEADRAPDVEASSDGGPSWGDFWPDQLGEGKEEEGKHESHESHGGMLESGACAARLVGTVGAAAALL